jgi:hypothetical protein
MSATVFCNTRTVVHKSSNDTSFAFPDPCKTPTPAGPIPIPYPNIAKSSDTAKGSKKVKCDGNPIMLKDSNYSMSTGDEAGSVGNVVTSKIKGKAYFLLYSFDTKVEGKNVCRFLDPMTHNHSSSPPPGTPPGPDVGGSIGMGAMVDIERKTLTASVLKLELQSGIPMESKGIKGPGLDNPFAAGDLPPSGKPNWERKGDGSPPDDKNRFPGVYTIKKGDKKLRVDVDITDLENVSGEGELYGTYLGIKITAKKKVPLKKGPSGWIDCKFSKVPKGMRYVPGAGIKWYITAENKKFGIGETKVEIFFTVGDPLKPWAGKKVWYEALKYSFVNLKVGYLKKFSDILTSITRGLHGCGLGYDTVEGGPLCNWAPGYQEFVLSDFLRAAGSLPSAETINCYDMAGTVVVFSSVLGVKTVKSLYLDDYGFILPTFLVGVPELCNCPFYKGLAQAIARPMTVPQMLAGLPAPAADAFRKVHVPLKPQFSKVRTAFGNHAIAILGKRIYDACAGPYLGGGSVRDYAIKAIDTKRTRKIIPGAVGNFPGWTLSKLCAQTKRYSISVVS